MTELENFKAIANWLNKLCKEHNFDAKAEYDKDGVRLINNSNSTFAYVLLWNGDDFYIRYKQDIDGIWTPVKPLLGVQTIKCVIREMLVRQLTNEINWSMSLKKA